MIDEASVAVLSARTESRKSDAPRSSHRLDFTFEQIIIQAPSRVFDKRAAVTDRTGERETRGQSASRLE